MDFEPGEAAAAVREGVAAVAARYDDDYWRRCDAQHRFPIEAWRDLADGGWVGLCVPEEYGGGGLGLLETAIACETFAAGGGAAATFLYILTPGFGAMTLSRHGTSEQQAQLLPGLATGDLQFCLALTEPDAGSNVIEITTSAERDGDEFVVTGQKTWISNVENADWMLCVTRTTPAAEASPRTAGFTILLVDVARALDDETLSYEPIPKLGGNVVQSSQVFLDGVRVPADRVVGQVDAGFGVLWDVLNPERVLAAAGAVGGADHALAVACAYANEREVFGRPIGANQGVQFPLAQVKAQVEAARLMTHRAAWLFDRGEPAGDAANMAKLLAAQVGCEAADRAFQVHGGMAYALEYPVARMFRDARIARNIPVSEELVLAHIATSAARSARPATTATRRPPRAWSTTTAGCTPVTSVCSTTTASCPSWTARRR